MALLERLRAPFADERSFWRFLAGALGLLACLKGLRPAGSWALTLSQIDYSHGFLKRGLYGTLLPLHHRHALTAAFALILLALLAALWRFTLRAQLEARAGVLALGALFASSYAVSFLVQFIGAADLLNALLCILLLLIRSPERRFAAALVVVPAALLIHENFLLVFLPVLLFSFVLDWHLAGQPRRLLAFPAVLGLLGLAITIATSLRPALTGVQAAALESRIAARTDFALDPEVFHIFTRGLLDNLLYTHSYARFYFWLFVTIGVANLLPAWLVLHHHVRRLTRTRRGLYPAALLAIFVPALMFPLGTDSVRWLVLIFLATYLVLLQLSRSLPVVAAPLTQVERNVILFLIALNMITGNGFFEGFKGAFYPFLPRLLH